MGTGAESFLSFMGDFICKCPIFSGEIERCTEVELLVSMFGTLHKSHMGI